MRKIIVLALAISLFSCKSETNNTNGQLPTKEKVSSEKLEAPSPEVAESRVRGKKIYNNFCATCHLASGSGIPNAFPPLNNSDWLREKRKESIAAVKNGLVGPIEVNGEAYNSVMADLGLTDQEVADVMNYILTAWDNSINPAVTVEEVQGIR